MSRSSIEWTQATWNPIVGCSIISPGCTNCYAMKMAARIEGMNAEAQAAERKPNAPQYEGTTHNVNGNNVWTGKLARASEKTLHEPLRTKRPTLYFVNSMSDLFLAPWDWIDEVFAVMARTPQHTYQILTKRSREMQQYCNRFGNVASLVDSRITPMQIVPGAIAKVWPLPNVWLGVSTERQKEADERIPELAATPAAVRFISAEPLLGPIDLTRIQGFRTGAEINVLDDRMRLNNRSMNLDWVIVGGESGPGSRPMHPDWARALRDQCGAARVPFFFKQWGNWYPIIDRDKDSWDKAPLRSDRDCEKYRVCNYAGGQGFHGERVHLMQRYGKKQAGRELDGKLHDGMPATFGGRGVAGDQLEAAQ